MTRQPTLSVFEKDAVQLAQLVENAPMNNALTGMAANFLAKHGHPTIRELQREQDNLFRRAMNALKGNA